MIIIIPHTEGTVYQTHSVTITGPTIQMKKLRFSGVRSQS